MNALEKNIAVARGEAIAASLLASAALQTALLLVPNRTELLAGIYAFVDDTLNASGPGKGDANDDRRLTVPRLLVSKMKARRSASSSGKLAKSLTLDGCNFTVEEIAILESRVVTACLERMIPA
jgi:hypothetical protein